MSAGKPWLAWLCTAACQFFHACPPWLPRPLKALPLKVCVLLVRMDYWSRG